MIRVSGGGRLCNQVYRFLAVSIIAKKHDLAIHYETEWYEKVKSLGIELYSGNTIYDTLVDLDETNFTYYRDKDTIDVTFNRVSSFFQTKEISNYFYTYLRSEEVMNTIISCNIFKERYTTNNDCFVHIRLGDVTKYTPGFNYYSLALSKLSFDTLYISSDSIDHEIITKLREKYPTAILLDYNEKDTIHFGSTCKHIVLSFGSFSSIIGLLSFYSDIYYPRQDFSWCPDIFSNPTWTMIDY